MRWFAITLLLIIIDQFTKWFATRLNWSIFLNDQFAFSLPVPTVIMFLIYAVVMFGISIYVYRVRERFNNIQKLAWSFVYAGGLSNIGERIVLGHVRDFIPLLTGIFNFADFYIFIGLILMLVSQRYSSTERSTASSASQEY